MARWRKWVLAAVMLVSGGAATAQVGSPFTWRAEPDAFQLEPGSSQTVHVYIQVPLRHYLYKEKTALEFQTLEGLRVKSIGYPPAQRKFDQFFGKELEIYDRDVAITVTIEALASLVAGPREVQALLTYQGCSDKLCFRLEERQVQWAVQVGGAGQPSTPPRAAPTPAWRWTAPRGSRWRDGGGGRGR